jgi:hypothetical protein
MKLIDTRERREGHRCCVISGTKPPRGGVHRVCLNYITREARQPVLSTSVGAPPNLAKPSMKKGG